jgi:hypothetical protein
VSAWENYYLEYSPYPNSGSAILNTNPYFETGSAAPWTGQNGATVAATTAQRHGGSWSLQITPDGVTAVPQAQSDEIAVIPLKSYTFGAWLRTTSNATRNAGIFWFDAAHAFISANTISTALVAGTWTQYGPAAYPAPANAAFARIKTNDPGTPAATNPWWIDDATITAQVSDIPVLWADLTSRVRGSISITLGTPDFGSAAGTARPATLSATLENIDHALTFGNAASPLAVGWKPGRRIRCYEVIGNRRFDCSPATCSRRRPTTGPRSPVDQFVTVTAVDRLGRLGTARTFVSTVAEHVLYNAGDSLRLYYPLGDMPGGPYRPLVGAATFPPLAEVMVVAAGGDPARTATARPVPPIGGMTFRWRRSRRSTRPAPLMWPSRKPS